MPIFSTPASRSLRTPTLKEQDLTPSFTVELGRLGQEAKRGPCEGLSPFRLWSPPQLTLQERKDMPWKLTPLLLFLGWMTSVCSARTRTDLLNVCMDAKHHKAEPGPEDKLHNQVRMECGSGLGGGLFRQGRGSQGGGGGVEGSSPSIIHSHPELPLWEKMKAGWGAVDVISEVACSE